jgi:hypothetical protein
MSAVGLHTIFGWIKFFNILEYCTEHLSGP